MGLEVELKCDEDCNAWSSFLHQFTDHAIAKRSIGAVGLEIERKHALASNNRSE